MENDEFKVFDIVNEVRIMSGMPLKEERGVSKELLPLIDEMWNAVVEHGFSDELEDGVKVCVLTNYEVNCPYIKNFSTFLVELGENHQVSNFKSFAEQTFINDDKKFENVFIVIGLDTFTKKEFELEFAHELNHLYRNYHFLLNGSNVDKEKERATLLYKTFKSEEKNEREDGIIKMLFYLTDIDEINARANSLYLKVYNDNKINRTNFREKINDNSAIQALKTIRYNLRYFNKNIPIEYQKIIGDNVKRLIDLYKDNTNIEVFYLFRRRLINAMTRIEKQNLKVIELALQNGEQEGKKINESIPIYSKYKDKMIESLSFDIIRYFEELKEINRIREMMKKMN